MPFHIVAVVAVAGCGKKKKAATAPVPADQQTAIAGIGTTSMTDCMGNIDTYSGSNWLGGYRKSKGGRPAPSGWTLDPTTGWYWKDYDANSKYGVHWLGIAGQNNDPWADPTPGDPEGIEWKWVWSADTASVSHWLNYYLRCQYASNFTDTLHVEGEWYLDYHLKYNVGTGVYDLSYNWKMTYDGVSVSTADCAGHYTLDCTFPYYATTGGVTNIHLTGEFTIAGDGTGNGWIKADGTEIIKYTFTSCGHGYYTLAAENWGKQYTF